MCTASWLIRPDGYELFFNRDERSERLRAAEPEALELRGRKAIAPRDGDGGGTWIGVNDRGLGLGLLNVWDDSENVADSPRSRGLLVLDLLHSDSQAHVQRSLEELDLTSYRGFHLVVFTPGREPLGHRWDGRELKSAAVAAPLASSSFDAKGAHTERARQWDGLRERHGGLTPGLLELFHASHYPERGPYSVCMHREDASTVSATHICVEAGEARVRYSGGPPCTVGYGDVAVLALSTGEIAYP